MHMIKKLLMIVTFIAAVVAITTGLMSMWDKIISDDTPMWEQSIPLDELEKYRGKDGIIRIEKGISITPEEICDDTGSGSDQADIPCD